MTIRDMQRLRMLADWQLRELGYDPAEITRKALEMDEALASFEEIKTAYATLKAERNGES